MKKHSKCSVVLSFSLVLAMMLGTMTGCGSSAEETEVPKETTAYEAELSQARASMDKVMSADADEAMTFEFNYDPAECIWVDDEYENMPLDSAALKVTDEDVDGAAEAFCEQYAEETTITDRAAETGDTVVIDFEGTVDGKIICKETGYELELGTDDINQEFEDAIVGANTDDVVNAEITYSEDIEDETLAGKTVDYSIRVRQIKTVTIPELTEDLVKEHTEYTSVAAYKEAMREIMKKEFAMDAIDGWLSENSYLIAIPSSLKEKYQDELVAYYSYVAEYYDKTDLDSVLKEAGYDSTDAMLEDNEDSIKDSIQNELMYVYVLNAQNLTATMGDYQDFLKEQASSKGCSEVGELLILYSEDDLRLQFMASLVDDWIYERCTIK